MSDEKLTVFIVDDDVSVRESLAALFLLEGWEPRLFETARAFLADHAVTGPCCLILDIGLPDLNGLELQTILEAERAEIPIVFVTGLGDVPTSVRAMKAGALEFLPKPFEERALLSAVHSAIDRSRTAIEERSALEELKRRHSRLTKREREVMALVVKGLMNKQIAWELSISEITVKAHRGKVMRKMESRSLPELVRMSGRLKLDIDG